ncbi:MAG: 4-hydroxy-2-oxovalerate aldolase [Chloroflexi bacterium]|nr:4-hydroxy-2-oxovalerate aldolase [Chloroflexota bacterium]
MRKSKILAKLRAGQPVKMAMLGHFVPGFVAYAAHLGYDGIWLDLEHRPMDAREIQALLAFFHLYDIDCVLRTPTREKAQLYRYLEDGATGLIVPHVSDVQSARELVAKTKFPPLGDRGLEGRGLEGNFGLDTRQTREVLVEHALRETFLVVQIETPEGLAVVEQIAALPGLDALYVGPSDLSVRMKHQPPAAQSDLAQTFARVKAACDANGKWWGSLPRSVDEARQLRALGAQIMVWGTDLTLLLNGLQQASIELDNVLGV